MQARLASGADREMAVETLAQFRLEELAGRIELEAWSRSPEISSGRFCVSPSMFTSVVFDAEDRGREPLAELFATRDVQS